MSSGVSVVYVEDSSDKTITGVWGFDRDNGGVLAIPFGTSFPATPEADELFLRTDTMLLYKRNSGNTAWESVGVDASSVDHGTLAGLLDDDHTQYQLRTEKGAANGYAGLDASSEIADATHGTRAGGGLHAEATMSSAGFASAADKVKINGAIQSSEKGSINGVASLDATGKVPTAQIPASALPEVHVVADAAARMALTVQEGDEAIQTDDGSHWIYDGTAWHQYPTGTGDVTGPGSSTDDAVARFDGTTGKVVQNSPVTIDDSGNIATPGTVDGRDVSVDGAKLDGIASGATNTPLTNTAPTDVTKASAAVGTSSEASRSDHKHDVATATPAALSAGGTNQEGSASTLSRSDHVHQLPSSFPPSGSAGGQLGGTYPDPDVRGLRETSGPTLLTLGAVSDGQFLKRDGSTVIGDTPGAPAQVVIVAKSGGDFTSVYSAIASITDATVSKPYTVLVYPGVYVESAIVMKAYVELRGIEERSVIIRASNAWSTYNIQGVANSRISELTVDGPLHGSGVYTSSGPVYASNIKATNVNRAFAGMYGSGNLIVENCKAENTVVYALYASSSGKISASGVLSYATHFAYSDSGEIWVHNSGASGCSNGLEALNGGIIYFMSVTLTSVTYGVQVNHSGTKITGTSLECRGTSTYDIRQMHADSEIVINGGRIRKDSVYALGWSNINLVVQDEEEENIALEVQTALHVGIPELGRRSTFGEGDAYTRGMRVYTTDDTTTSTTDGGNITNVTDDAASATSSTFTLQGTGVGYSILIGSALTDGTNRLKWFGLLIKQTVASVVSSGNTHDSFVFEYWNGTTWTEVGSFATSVEEHHRYANEVFLRANSLEHLRFGINGNSSVFPWAEKTILGTQCYWMRVRIATALTTAPTFEQFKISPSRLEVMADGHTELHGSARFTQTIVAAGNVFGESGGVSNGSFNVGSGSVPNGWSHKVKNSRFDGNGDGIYIQFPLPKGVCTSCPWYVKFTYYGDKTAQDIDWICSFLPVEVSGILEADVAGGVTPVARTLSNTETVTAKAAQTDSALNVDQVVGKFQELSFGPFTVCDYYEGDMMMLRLEMDNDGPDNANPTVASFEVVGVMWTYGGHA